MPNKPHKKVEVWSFNNEVWKLENYNFDGMTLLEWLNQYGYKTDPTASFGMKGGISFDIFEPQERFHEKKYFILVKIGETHEYVIIPNLPSLFEFFNHTNALMKSQTRLAITED